MQLILLCKKCNGPIDASARAGLAATGRVLLDAACPNCGKRALYPVPQRTAAWD